MKLKILRHPIYVLLLTAAALVLAGSFLLPNMVARITDSRRLDKLVTIDSQSISFDTMPELALQARIAFVASPNTENLALKTGQVMDYETACDKALGELERFFSGGPFKLVFDKLVVEDCEAAFVIDTENPSVNIIIWELAVSDPLGNAVNLTIDDETGVILKLIYRLGNNSYIASSGLNNAIGAGQSDEDLNTMAIRLTEMMASYFGLPIILADYKYSGSLAYYRADVLSNDDEVPMYGVVRAAGFTMNEKLLY